MDVPQFYKDQNVLITGASGFLGKVIVWKLVNSCPGVGKIYVLIRPKNGQSAEKRLQQMLKGKPFTFQNDPAELAMKLVALEADMTAKELGLSLADKQTIQDNVHIVIHSAASVKFDAPLKDNLRDNVYGTRSITNLCKSIKNLKSFVHVSTAYSNCHAHVIEEKLVPLKLEANKAIQFIESLPDKLSEEETMKYLDGRPNTYTYTKAIAEHIVFQHKGEYPISLVRPSIVTPAHHEPCPGWVDNVNGIGGLGSLAAIGMLRTIDWNYYGTSDMVPVDLVANNIVCAAYSANQRGPNDITIYNMTSGNMCPITWGKYFDLCRHYAMKTPPTKIVRPMIEAPRHRRAHPVSFALTRIFSELLFAYVVDTILSIIGYKRLIVRITKRMHHGYKVLLPFTSTDWEFKSDNVVQLNESLTQPDRATFKFDMRNFDWPKQAASTWSGAREFLLKEKPDEDSYKTGKNRMIIVTIVHYTFLVLFLLIGLSLAGISAYRFMPSQTAIEA